MRSKLSDERFRDWMKSLIRKLLLNFTDYFSKDCVLNSDGRKLLEEIARNTVKRHPEFKGVVSKVRRDPTLNNVIKLARVYLSDEEVDELLMLMHASLRYYLGKLNT